MNQMLQGVRVLEMSNVISGPYCGALLADLGAEIMKVEMPGTGDTFRGWATSKGKVQPPFAALNRGKKSITLDVKNPEGREAYLRAAESADVLIENFRPGTLDRLGIGYSVVSERNPRLVYCAISGLGHVGPYKSRPTFDAIAQAMSGLWSQLTDKQEPRAVGPALSDQLTGLFAAYGVLGALVEKQRTGQGRKLDLSMLAASIAFQPLAMADYLMNGNIADDISRARVSQSYAFVARDKAPIAVHLSSPPKFWKGLLIALGREDLEKNPRFAERSARVVNYDALREELQHEFAKHNREHWLAVLEANDVPCGPLYDIGEALNDPQVRALNLTQTYGKGERALELLGCPIDCGEATDGPGLPVPQLGEHTETILVGLGYTAEDIERLQREGAI